MTNISNSEEERIQLLNVAWWMHLGTSINGDILICGDLNTASIDLILTMCDKVYIFEESCYINPKNKNVIRINNATLLDHVYDGIILDKFNNFYDINDKQTLGFINNNLNPNGAICIFEPNIYSLRNANSNLVKKITNLFHDLRMSFFRNISTEYIVSKYQTFAYDKIPYESYKKGVYSSNKNTFAFKERLKKILLKSSLSRLLTNSNIWVVQKSDKYNNLINLVIEYLSDTEYMKKYTEMDYEIIYYKHSKIIFSLKDPRFYEEFIVVIALDDEAILQRDNEMKTINYLRGIEQVKDKVTEQYFHENINNLNCYIMKSYQGVTVDIKNNNSSKMIVNAFNVLMSFSDATLNNSSNNDEHLYQVKKYFEILSTRIPGRADKILNIQNYVIDSLSNINLISVCMHGDFKLENSVLDDSGEVIGLIDWELSEIKGLPMIDLLYLITYNHEVEESKEFEEVYMNILNNDMHTYESDMMFAYCKHFSISQQQRLLLTIIFFIHHFSRRFYIEENNKAMIYVDKCIDLIIYKLKKESK